MTRLDELAGQAGAAVREDARRRSAHAPPLMQVRRRRVRRRAGLVGGAAAVAVGAVVFAGGWLMAAPQLQIDDPIGAPTDPVEASDRPSSETDPGQPSSSAEVTGPDALLPGGWAPAWLPVETAERTVIAASSGALSAFVVAGDQGMRDADLIVRSDEDWGVHEDAVDREPDALATTADDGGWVFALATGSASLFAADGTAAALDPIPADLDGGVTGAAWRRDGFVVVGRADGPQGPTPVFSLDPHTGSWRALPGAPLAVNRDWNSSVVSAGDDVYVVGTWLGDSNEPGLPNLAAAHLNADNAWTLLDGGTLSPQSADAVAVDDRVLAVDYNGDAAWLDHSGWSEPAPTGIPSSECGSQLSVNDHHVLAAGCEAAVFDRRTQTWTRIAPPTPREQRALRRAIASPDGFLVPTVRRTNFGATANDVLALEPNHAWPLEPGIQGLIARPSGWTIATEPLVDEVADRELVTLSTAAMPTGGAEHCDQLPTAALEGLADTDALVSIRTAAADAPPEAPSLGTLSDLETGRGNPAPADCASDIAVHRTSLRYGPETLELIIAHGRDAPNTILDEALAIANSYSLG